MRLLEGLVERLKAASDRGIMFLLVSLSEFERELTDEGRAEQTLWREQRLRDLRGLSLRAKQRWGDGR
jgi:hypothetical protein